MLTESAGAHQRRLVSVSRAMTVFPAKTCAGSEASSSSARSMPAEANPEIAMAASMAETTMNRRLLPVLSAATTITSTAIR